MGHDQAPFDSEAFDIDENKNLQSLILDEWRELAIEACTELWGEARMTQEFIARMDDRAKMNAIAKLDAASDSEGGDL